MADAAAPHDATRREMLELGDRLRDLDDPAAMAAIAAELMGRHLRVSAAAYATMDADDRHITAERDWTAGGATRLAGTYLFEDYGSYVRDLRAGRDVVIADVAADPRTRDRQAGFAALRIRALINLPIMERGRLAAAFFVVCDAPRAWTPAEVGFVRELAERVRAEIERRRAEQELRRLAGSLEAQVAERTRERDMIWRATPDLLAVATLDGELREVNPAWTDALGWTQAELVGRPYADLVHPDDRAATAEQLAAHRRGEGCFGFENRYATRDGGWRWFSWNAVPREGLVYCVVRDVTDAHEREEALVRMEDALRQAQKMEAVGQLTGGLAHDFNNLLAGISGALELMTVRIGQGRFADLDRYVGAAQDAARRAAALTHRLLAFSRRQPLDPRPTDVNRLVADMAELVRRSVGPDIAVEVRAAAGLWPVLVDPPQLENALLNLCINGRDAMPDGGRLVIETANHRFDRAAAREHDLPAGHYVSLSVTDTGTGMDAEVMEKAFDPFFTTKPMGAGTGLGLSMIYGFAKQSGGQARIRSAPGEGATVGLFLPRHAAGDAPVEAAAPPPRPATARLGETVLVVDDEPTVRMLVVEVLAELGYRVVEAADGAGGLRALEAPGRLDLLVTDVGLPGGMNGRQLADLARALRPGLRVLFITGYAETALLTTGRLAPGMAVLAKPFTFDALAARVRELIGR